MKKLGKTIGSVIGIAGAIVFSTSNIQAQNLLVNGSFENASEFIPYNPLFPSGFSGSANQGWSGFAGQSNPIPSQSDMSGSPDKPEDGNDALLTQNAPGNNWDPAGAYQIVSGVTAGELYTFSSWYLTDTGFTGSFSPNVCLEINFLNSSLTLIGTAENPSNPYNEGFNGGFSYAIPAKDTWYQGSISGTAPAGAEYAMVLVMFMDNAQTTTENVYFDNASLTLVPEPSTLTLIGIGLAIPFYFIRWGKTNSNS